MTVHHERALREQVFWDSAYLPNGAAHSKYLWAKQIEAWSYIGVCFRRLIQGLSGRRILSLGGGVDQIALRLARAGNRVVTVDVSAAAAAENARLAEEAGLGEALTPLIGTAEEVPLESNSFDVVLCKRALHHMDITRVVERVHEVLAPGGSFLAEEPICLLPLFRWLHRTCPFHPTAPRTPDERELTVADLQGIRKTFRQTAIAYHDFLARESVAFFLFRGGVCGLLRPLGRIDAVLMNRLIPGLKYLGSYALVHATK